ncbi:MAG: ATP-binding protein [Myxococcales bacterium]|nr:ATP-binding protein [Myxococcales bacterium]
MSGVTLHRTEVDLGGLLEVLGKHLYSTPAVVVRELVQNAHDSCVRRRLETEHVFEPRITLEANPEAGTLVIEDNGMGLTDEEIQRWLATVGRGATRELRKKADADAEGLIGQFGVGFLTAYFVSERVDVETTSAAHPDEGWHFSSRGGERYALRPAPARAPGTRVTLHLNDAAREVAAAVAHGGLAADYFSLLPTPVFLGFGAEAPVNDLQPPWRIEDLSPVRRKKLELEIAARFEPLFEPLTCISVPDHEEDRTQGLLWIQDGASYLTSDHRHVSVFVRGMLVTHDARDLLPPWAGFVGAVVESRKLEPTASREELQASPTKQILAARLERVLIEGLEVISREEPETWRAIVRRHGEALRGAALFDEGLFDCIVPYLEIPTTEGPLALETIARRSPDRKVHVSLAEDTKGPESVLYRALGVPVVQGTRYAVAQLVERWVEKNRARVVRLGTREGDAAAFPSTPVDEVTRAGLAALLGDPEWELVPTRFAPAALPFLLVPDREAELKARIESDEADRRISAAALMLARMHMASKPKTAPARLFVNLDCPVVGRATKATGPTRDAIGVLLRGLVGVLSRDRGAESLSAALSAISEGLDRLLPEEV